MSSTRSRRYFLVKCTLFLLAAVLVFCLYAGWEAWSFLNGVPETPGRDKVVDIEPGSTLAGVARQLQEQGVVTSADRFQLLARLTDQGRRLQAGQFLVSTGWPPRRVLEHLVNGQGVLYRVTVPEGLPWWEVGRLLEKEGICRAADFDAVIHDAEFLRKYGIPFASAQRFLYPDTNLVPRPREMDMRGARSFAGRMVDTFWRKTAGAWESAGIGPRPGADDLLRVLVLASIVEKETGLPEERPRVAGVYDNRLRKGMALQADPTVIYGLGPDFAGPLLRRHLEDSGNPYNTYRIPGLPPGPICSPGLSAVEAALRPESHDYLYFVATGRDRGHVFSATLAQHNRAVRAYRQALRERDGG